MHRTHHLRGYHEAVQPTALIALFAPMARSTNRSTAKTPAVPRPTTVCNAARGARPAAARANSQTPPRGVERIILMLDVRGGGLG